VPVKWRGGVLSNLARLSVRGDIGGGYGREAARESTSTVCIDW
jgi:hypothetical protein